MNYKEQLDSFEWRSKRNKILERDNFCCRNCGLKRTPYIGLSQKDGIKSFKEMINKGFTLKKTDDSIGLLFLKNKVLHTAKYIEKEDKKAKIEDLYFAWRWKEPINKFVFGSYELICFSKKIEINDRFPDLNVHHKYYIEGKNAWEYENDALITLCENCHKEEHESNAVKVFDENGQLLYIPQICDRCDGSGYLTEFHYYQNGICFKCGGNGIILK